MTRMKGSGTDPFAKALLNGKAAGPIPTRTIGPERPGKDTSYTLDSQKLRTELGWRDTVPLEQGVDDVIRWAEQFKNEIATLPAKYEHKA